MIKKYLKGLVVVELNLCLKRWLFEALLRFSIGAQLIPCLKCKKFCFLVQFLIQLIVIRFDFFLCWGI
jgi:hypothetical protein